MLRTTEGGSVLSEMAVVEFERRRRRALPATYRDFLKATNGGRPERDLIVVPGCEASPYARVHFFLGLSHPIEAYNLDWNMDNFDDLPVGWLPIAKTEGADMFCLAPNGVVVFFDGYGGPCIEVADDFAQFVSKLYRDDLSPALERFS